MNKKYVLNSLLPPVLLAVLLAMVLVRTFLPRVILPQLDIPMLTAISLAALLAEHYLAPGAPRNYLLSGLWAALSFGLMGFAALLGIPVAVQLAVKGGIVFTAVTWLFTAMTDRLSSGPAAKAAPLVSAVGLYLAAQCLMGMF